MLVRRSLVGPMLAALWTVAACDRDPTAALPRVRATTIAAPAPLVRVLGLELAAPAAVTVDYSTDGEPALRVVSDAATSHALVLARLLPGRSYRYRVVGTPVEGTFTSGALPPGLEGVRLTTSGTPTSPLVMLHLYDPDPAHFRGYAAVDGAGRVVWTWRTADFPFGMTRRANGDFVFLDRGRGLVEVTPAGEVVHELPQDIARREMHHDATATPANTILFIAFDDRTFEGARLRGDAIWEWAPEAGTEIRRWTAWDHFSPATDRGPRFGTEWMHANALSLGPRGNVLLGVHYWDQVLSITGDWRAIEWRLGGVNATKPVAVADHFSGQHTPAELAGGRLLMFDNGVERGGYSRALELDVSGDSARPAWEWRAAPANFATALGSARRLPNGDTMIAFGMSPGFVGSTGPIEVYEVDPRGAVVWHLVVEGPQSLFRAEPLTTIAGERPAP